MYPLLITVGALFVAAWAYGASKVGVPRDMSPPNLPPVPGTVDGHGTGVLDGVLPPLSGPLPSLPPLPTGTLPALPPPGQPLPQLDPIPPSFVPGVFDGDALGPIVVGDVINVDMFRSGMAIPQNLPVVGLVFMRVLDLNVPGDTQKKKLRAGFVSAEFRVLGDQDINRSSIVEKVVG